MNQINHSVQQAGTLDASFARAGIFRLSRPDLGRDSLLAGIQADTVSTHLYFAGQMRTGITNRPYILGRLKDNGDADETFAKEGIASGFFAGNRESMANSITLLSDGKILLAGTVGAREPALARFLSDGRLDTGFGENGCAILPLPEGAHAATSMEPDSHDQTSSAHTVALADGKILVVKTYVITHLADTRAFIYRLNSDGSPDPSFNKKGYVQVVYPGAAPADVKLHSALTARDGRIIACGELRSAAGAAPLLVCYSADGSLVSEFGTEGFVITPVAEPARLVSIIAQPNNRLLGIGEAGELGGLLISREADGSANIQFNRGKPLNTRLDNHPTHWKDAVMQADGKIVLIGGYKRSDQPSTAVVARMLPDGEFDPTFNGVGWTGTNVDGRTGFQKVALQEDGKIVVAGDRGESAFQGLVLRFHGR